MEPRKGGQLFPRLRDGLSNELLYLEFDRYTKGTVNQTERKKLVVIITSI